MVDHKITGVATFTGAPVPFDDGAKVFKENGEFRCPYPQDTERGQEWLRGYREAAAAAGVEITTSP